MRSVCILLVVFASCFYVSYCKDLIVGTSYNNRLIWQHKAEYAAYPFTKRTKDVFFSDPAQQIIKGVIARDLDHTEAEPTITAGGPGQPYVNIRLKSEKGTSMNFQIEVYV